MNKDAIHDLQMLIWNSSNAFADMRLLVEGAITLYEDDAESIGSLTLDADERSATLAGEEIPLTVREFNLLYKLLSYPKKTFTRSQLMDEFWDAESSSGPRTVDVYMTKLRGKLADCDAFELVTVHGLGYKAVIK